MTSLDSSTKQRIWLSESHLTDTPLDVTIKMCAGTTSLRLDPPSSHTSRELLRTLPADHSATANLKCISTDRESIKDVLVLNTEEMEITTLFDIAYRRTGEA